MPTIKTCSIRAIGPITSTTIRVPPVPEGSHLIISGPSETGKTTALHALALILCGTSSTGGAWPTELIHDGENKAAVAIGLADGTALRTSITESRSRTWDVLGLPQVAGQPDSRPVESVASQGAWQALLGLDPTIALAILAPGRVAQLGEQARGRPLRDLLLSVLPEADHRAIVRRYVPDLRDDEPVVEASAGKGKARSLGAADRATDARRARDHAAGALQAREATMTNVKSSAPTAPATKTAAELSAMLADAGRARNFLARLDAWEAYERALAAHRRTLEAIDAQHAAVVSYEARRAALGAAPAHPGDCPSLGALLDEEAAMHRALAELRAVRESFGTSIAFAAASARLTIAQSVLEKARKIGTGTCDACGQPVTPEHAAAHLAAAEAEHLAAEQALDRVIEQDRLDHERIRAERRKLDDAAAARHATAAEALDAGRQAVAAHQAAMVALAAHSRALAALGQPPATPDAVPTAPAEVVAPAFQGTASDARARAEAMIRSYDAAQAQAAGAAAGHAAALTRWQAQVAEAEAAHGAAAAAHAAACAEVARAELILDVVRRAPTEAAAQAAASLQAALPARTGVRVVFGTLADGAPEAGVLIDGRPWWLASTGRQIAADCDLRLALRELAAARYPGGLLSYADVPVVVDGGQSWSGRLSARGPVWVLETADESAVSVDVFNG
jgi:DNA polymerase III delta prime subunit